MDYAMKVFNVVAKESSFSQAANILYTSQSNISHIIKKLEQELDIKLIERQHNSIRLTRAGEELLIYSDDYLDRWNGLINNMRWLRENPIAPINVGAVYLISNYVVQNFVLPHHDNSQNKRIINLVVGNGKEIMLALRCGKVDFAFLSDPIDDKGCIVEPFRSDEIVLVINRDHIWRQKRFITLDMLETMPYISREEGSTTQQLVELQLSKVGIDIKTRFNIAFIGSNYHTVLQAVKNGIGYSFIPLSAIRNQLADGALFTVPIQDFSIYRDYSLVTLKATMRIPEQKRIFYQTLDMVKNADSFP